MKKLNEAVKEWLLWKAKGINAKIVWHYRTQSYMVVFIFYPQVKGWYELVC